jgi:hypothetical protein
MEPIVNEFKGTPGPWAIDPSSDDGTTGIYSPVEHVNGRDAHVCIIQHDDEHPWDGVREQANAALIAAAPELLAALEAVMRTFVSSDHDDWPDVVQARTAIARATGAP